MATISSAAGLFDMFNKPLQRSIDKMNEAQGTAEKLAQTAFRDAGFNVNAQGESNSKAALAHQYRVQEAVMKATGTYKRHEEAQYRVQTATSQLEGAQNRLVSAQARFATISEQEGSSKFKTYAALKQVQAAQNGVTASQNKLNDANVRLDATNQKIQDGFASAGIAMRNEGSAAEIAAQQQEKRNAVINEGKKALDDMMGVATKVGKAVLVSLIPVGQNVMQTSDAYASVNARLGMVNDGTRTQKELQDEVYASAMRTRDGYTDVAQRISQIDASAGGLFSSNDQLIGFTENIGKAVAVGGGGSQQQAAVTQQMSQALSSGTMDGNAFDTLMQDAPYLMQQLAEGMSVPTEKLKEMAAQGELTAQSIADALLSRGAEIDAAFLQLPVTFDSIATMGQNAWGQLVSSLDEAGMPLDNLRSKLDELVMWLNTPQGASFLDDVGGMMNGVIGVITCGVELTAAAVQWLGENLDWLAPILMLVTVVGLTLAAILGIVTLATTAAAIAATIKGASEMMAAGGTLTATAAQYGLNAAILACPVTWLIVLIVALIAVLVFLVVKFQGVRDAIGTVVGGIVQFFADMVATVAGLVQGLVNSVIESVNGIIDALNTVSGLDIAQLELVTFGDDAAAWADGIGERVAGKVTGGLDNFSSKFSGNADGTQNLLSGLDFGQGMGSGAAVNAQSDSVDADLAGILRQSAGGAGAQQQYNTYNQNFILKDNEFNTKTEVDTGTLLDSIGRSLREQSNISSSLAYGGAAL